MRRKAVIEISNNHVQESIHNVGVSILSGIETKTETVSSYDTTDKIEKTVDSIYDIEDSVDNVISQIRHCGGIR